MKKLTLAFLLFANLVTYAQSVKKFTIKEAVDYAITNNLDLSKTEIEKKIVQAQIAEVKGQSLPQINLNLSGADNFSLAEQQLPAEIIGGEPGTTVGVKFGNRYTYSGGVDVQQKLFDVKLFTAIKSAQTIAQLQELQTLRTKEDLVINVIQVYTQIQIIEKELAIQVENINRVTNLIELSELKLKEGIMRKLDVGQLKVNRMNLLTEIERAKYDKNESIRLFKILLNDTSDDEIVLSQSLDDAKMIIQDNLSLEDNISLQETEKRIEISKIDEDLVKAEFYPTLNAYFNYNYQGNANQLQFTGPGYADQFNGTWGLRASIPVFDGFQKRKRVLQKELATEKLEVDKKVLVQNIEKEFDDAKEKIEVTKTQVKNQSENMVLANENYDGIKLSFSEGIAPITELLDSEFALRQAQSNYLNAQLQLRLSEIQLVKASGQLSKLISQN